MGPHTDGGGLIDADIQRRSPEYANGHKRLAGTFATVNRMFPTSMQTMVLLKYYQTEATEQPLCV